MERNILKSTCIKTGLLVFIVAICLSGYGNAAETSSIAIDNDTILLIETIKQNYLASLRLEALKTKNSMPDLNQTNNTPSLWLKRVKANEVNMVTNRYTKETLSETILSGKVYYASGEMVAWTLQQNPSLRFTKDPLTHKIVDKSDAVIYVDASGRALYFESDETYKNFIALADQEAVYGYTKP